VKEGTPRCSRRDLCQCPSATGIIWGGRWDLNPRHSVPQTDALPAELRPPEVKEEVYAMFLSEEREGERSAKRRGSL
jgi:hypothetical protein